MPEVVGVIHESKSEVANARSLWLLAQMNVEYLKAEVETLTPDERARLFRFTLYLNMSAERRSEERRELLAAIEENDATPWGGMDRVKRNLAELEDAELHVRAVVASHP